MSSSEGRRQKKAIEKLQRKAAQEQPVMEFNFTPMGLVHGGPIITTSLAVTQSHADLLIASGLPVPPPVACRFLVDTGADGTMVKHEFAERAGLKLIATGVAIHGVGIETDGRIYLGRIVFAAPSKVAAGIQHAMFVDTQVTSGRLNDSIHLDGLIGRDVLNFFDMRYNGRTGQLTMRFQKS